MLDYIYWEQLQSRDSFLSYIQAMFSFLFGKPAVAPVPPPRPSGPSETTRATLAMLSNREADLDKRITMLEKQIAALHSEAVVAHKAGLKSKAVMALKKKAMYEEQFKTNNAMLLKLMEQRAALESTFINTDTLNVMSHATAAMKAEQATWSVDRVTDLNEELQDVKDAHREINTLLQESVGDGPSDEELLAELEEPTVAPVAVPLPELPAVPTTALPAVGGAGVPMSEMERELERVVADLRLPA